MKKPIDRIGQRVSKLVCIAKSEIENRYIFKCDCGNTCLRYNSIFNEKRSYQHRCCGCSKAEMRAFNKAKSFKGCGNLTGAYVSMIRWRANKKGIEYNLDAQYLWELFLSQNKQCIYSGLELVFKKGKLDKTIPTASLDRIDSKKGYIKGNVQWVHKDVNYIKNKYEENKFLEICALVSKYN